MIDCTGKRLVTVCLLTIGMSALDRVMESGLGALFLYLYSAGVLYWLQLESVLAFESSRFMILIAAVVPPAIVVFLATVFNDGLMEILAGDAIEESFREINSSTGEDEFYWDAETEIQDSIDEMDEKAHKHLVTVLSGAVIAFTLPVLIYVFLGLFEALQSVTGALLIIYLFCYRSYRDLQQVVKSSVKVYDTENED